MKPIEPGGFRFLINRFSVLFSGQLNKSAELSSGLLLSATRHYTSQVVLEPTTSDGLTVDDIVAQRWPVLPESNSDWKSHAASIAQSIQLIKRRLQWRKIIIRLEQLSTELNKSDLWDDPIYAGRISREHGTFMGKIKEVNGFEQELLEHIDMLKLAREENDRELESGCLGTKPKGEVLLGFWF